MKVVFAKPASASTPSTRPAGGDSKVPRDGRDRPRIRIACDAQGCTRGRVASEKRPGATVKCRKCGQNGAAPGEILRSYTRVTSYIDVLEDKSSIHAWDMRNVLLGVARDPDLLNGVLSKNPEFKQHKDWLNRRAQSAKKVAGANEKSDKGTYKHSLSELIDRDEQLPDEVTFGDILDMDGYKRGTRFFNVSDIEGLVVVDQLKVAGTPDRASTWACYRHITTDELGMFTCDPGRNWAYVPLIAPDGSVILPTDKLITDLKTGTIEYGGLKMAMQLSIYARGEWYSHTPANLGDCRTPIENVRTDWGIIMNLPADTGELELYWADLSLGWEAVQLAGQVRDMRSRGRSALTRFELPMPESLVA
ncbi:hypothetical protein OG474_30415 [Kribbella sp. NBC_01505]|uniref:hypothetical protein n=1 Tax=Kribbella sp. NBC_01505 TaxID=2903580 RepID=UPI0038640DD3